MTKSNDGLNTTLGRPANITAMRRFVLERAEDVSGVSGTGRVAEGVEFSDGTVVMKWMTYTSSLGVYLNIKELDFVHSHEGRTKVVWID